MAEYFLAQIINNEKSLYQMWDNQKLNKWRTEVFINSRSVSELTVGIMGIGVLGSRLALAVKQRGATVYGLSRRPRESGQMGPYDKSEQFSIIRQPRHQNLIQSEIFNISEFLPI